MLALALLVAAAPADRAAELTAEAIRFHTVAGDLAAREAQKAWVMRVAGELWLAARDAGPVTEVELAGPQGAPVLGLVVHGDVQPVDEKAWTVPPFAGVVRDGMIVGRGAADDKGPLVQALLAMSALRGAPLTHTVRLLVGSDEESNNEDMKTYLASHEAPAYSLVLDSAFPVVVGEKAWDGLAVIVDDEAPRAPAALAVKDLEAGLAPSIVPDIARLTVAGEDRALGKLAQKLRSRKLAPGTRLELVARGGELDVIVHGKSAHAGVNLEGGRNALVSLARLVEGLLPDCGAADLLAFARAAGDLHGAGLGLTDRAEPGWGGWDVNVATVSRHTKHLEKEDGKLALVVNLRRPPPMTAAQSREWLFAQVKRLAPRLRPAEYYFGDEPLVFDRGAKLVRRLMEDYARATGTHPAPAVSGGGTYAKRIPRAIAFGMWFPGKPYPGHDVDEQAPVADLQRGLEVLTATLRDLATSPPLVEPFKP